MGAAVANTRRPVARFPPLRSLQSKYKWLSRGWAARGFWGGQGCPAPPAAVSVRPAYHGAQRVTFEFVASLPLELICALITDPHEADEQRGHGGQKGQEDGNEVQVFIEDLCGREGEGRALLGMGCLSHSLAMPRVPGPVLPDTCSTMVPNWLPPRRSVTVMT